MTRRRIIAIAAILAAIAIVVVGLVFKPWLLFVDVRVDDAIPPIPTAVQTPAAASPSPAPAEPVALSSGVFTSHEHETSGTATIIENPDGTVVLALTDLATSSGPDVHVWLSAADVVEGVDGWFTAGGAPYLDLGPIKGNLGNQVYEIPPGTDLSAYRSVDLWCVQFAVSFGAAQLG